MTSTPEHELSAITASSTSLSSASASADCPMMRAFARDSGSSFQLTDFLILNELAQLVGCCSLWKAWLAAPRSLAGRMRELPPASLPLFSRCEWVRQHVVSVVLTSGEPEQLDTALQLLPVFHRIQSLQITTKGQLIEEAVFERCFGAISDTLVQLEIILPTDFMETKHNDANIQACLNQCKRLSKLRDLRVTGTIARAAALDFSPLSALPLKTLRIGRPACDYSLTAEQTKQVCLIPTLTTVDLGAWLLPAEAFTVNGADTATTSQFIQQGLGTFMRSRQGAAPMRFLQLSQTLMNAELFRCLLAVPTLESIWPKRWRAGMTPDDWKELRLFVALRKLSVCPEQENELYGRMTVDEVLDGLGHCTTLTEIQLGTGFILRSQHVEQIARNLPALNCLVLFHCRVQTLAPLVDAPSLTALELRGCMDHEGGPPHWRITLPTLPRLTDLIIVDRDGTKLRPKQAEPLNAALLARMSSLTLAKFTQTLLPELELENEDGV